MTGPSTGQPAGAAHKEGEAQPASIALCLLLRGEGESAQVLLGTKLRGFGRGKMVLPGGHIEPGETGAQAAARELAEETGLIVRESALELRARILFSFPAEPSLDLDTQIYAAATGAGQGAPAWQGRARRTEELDSRWFRVDALPLHAMWQDAHRWLPAIARGASLNAHIVMAADGESVATMTQW